MPPPHHSLSTLLSAWENYLHTESGEPVLVKAALLHYQFEAIHPFLDGNGRIGRLLITLFLCEQKALSEPLLYLSSYFEKYREDYYRHLLSYIQNTSPAGGNATLLHTLNNPAIEVKYLTGCVRHFLV